MNNSQYLHILPMWHVVADAYQGVEAIKGGPNSLRYLPPQPAERIELEKGTTPFENTRYAFRRRIATYENIFKPTIDDICGLMQKNKPKLKFGVSSAEESPMEVRNMEWRGNRHDDGVYGLKIRVNAAQVLFGRYGMLLDVLTDRDGLEPQFCITEYQAHSILDGDYETSALESRKILKWALLDESSRKFNMGTKTWQDWPKRRLVALDGDGYYYNAVFEGVDIGGIWENFDINNPKYDTGQYELIYPTFKGERLRFVPLTICNVDRLGIENWQSPPYLDVAQVAIGNYMIDSWYKMGLYHFATPTLVICNASRESDDVRLGGVVWAKSNAGAPVSVQILETSGSGLGELRSAKEELKESLKYSSIRDLLGEAGANSSGDAIKLRTASGTAAISTIDKTGAKAIEEQLMFASIWAGASVKEAFDRICFEADTTYLGAEFQIQSVVSFLQANKDSHILSKQNAYAILERTFPGVLSSYDDNEAQLLQDSDETFQTSTSSASSILSAIESLNYANRLNISEENGDADEDDRRQSAQKP